MHVAFCRTASCTDFKVLASGAELVGQVGCAGFDVILVARTWPYSSLVEVSGDTIAGGRPDCAWMVPENCQLPSVVRTRRLVE